MRDGRDSIDARSVTTNEHGFFEISDVEPGRPYQVSIRAEGFSEWESTVVIERGKSKILNVSKLPVKEVKTAITVTPSSSDQIATQQVEAAEKQRGFLLIPNFYAVYTPNPEPLTPKLKVRLALRVARDPFTLAGVAVLAGIGAGHGQPPIRTGSQGLCKKAWGKLCQQLHRRHAIRRYLAIASSPGSPLLQSRDGHDKVARAPRAFQHNYYEGR
jgi:Carboxypeptidase regulatory-like domain